MQDTAYAVILWHVLQSEDLTGAWSEGAWYTGGMGGYM